MSWQRGFLLGKFMPPHEGHLHLIDTAASHCRELIILVCTLPFEPIPGELRFRWMQQLRGQHTLVHVTDVVPSAPDEHPRFWEIWEALLRHYLPPDIDIVFSSESYGDEIARRLGIVHMPVDPQRSVVPVSASMIRADPILHWDFIPPPVRPYFLRRVALLGPESSGKSVLAHQLAQRFHTAWVPEYGREHTAHMDSVRARIRSHDFMAIAHEHARRVEAAAARADRVLFIDTDALTTAIWSEWYLGHCTPELWTCVDRQVVDCYLLLQPDLPWEDDGTREFPARRHEHFARLRQEIERRGWNHAIIGGSGPARLEGAVEAVVARWPSLHLALSRPPGPQPTQPDRPSSD